MWRRQLWQSSRTDLPAILLPAAMVENCAGRASPAISSENQTKFQINHRENVGAIIHVGTGSKFD